MIKCAHIGFAVLMMASVAATACGQQILFHDDFEAGNLDQWSTFGVNDVGSSVWVEHGKLWAEASSSGDCSYSISHAVALVQGLLLTDFELETSITNLDACGWLGFRLRTTQEVWTSWSDIDCWSIEFDPGACCLFVGAKNGTTVCDGSIFDWSYCFGTDVTHYIKIVVQGSTIELWDKIDPEGDYALLHRVTCEFAPPAGYATFIAGQSAKTGWVDDFTIRSVGASPVEEATWARVKALYR